MIVFVLIETPYDCEYDSPEVVGVFMRKSLMLMRKQ
jgi:hypothetical protein